MVRELKACTNEAARVPEQRHRRAVGGSHFRQGADEVAVRGSIVDEQIGVGRQPMTQVHAGKRRATAEVKRQDTLTGLQKREHTGSDDARVETGGHGGYFAICTGSGGHGVSGRPSRYAHIARDRPRWRCSRSHDARIISGVTKSQTSRVLASRSSAPIQ